jgi:hypothetical protein
VGIHNSIEGIVRNKVSIRIIAENKSKKDRTSPEIIKKDFANKRAAENNTKGKKG